MKPDTRKWRVGTHYGLHLYAINPDGNDEALGTALTPETAAQIVAEHNAAIGQPPPIIEFHIDEQKLRAIVRDEILNVGRRVWDQPIAGQQP